MCQLDYRSQILFSWCDYVPASVYYRNSGFQRAFRVRFSEVFETDTAQGSFLGLTLESVSIHIYRYDCWSDNEMSEQTELLIKLNFEGIIIAEI